MLNWLTLTLLPPVGATLIRLLGRVIRLETRGAEPVDALYREGRRLILAFWHGRQLMIPIGYRGTGACVLISRHQDGELIHRIIARFGHRSARGSTTRGGVTALRQLIKLGRSGVDLVVTPDGPRGPRHVVQMGVMHLARATGLPIVPVTFSCSKKKHFKSWDRFLVPYPMGRGLFVWGKPIWVQPDASAETLESKRLELEQALNAITAEADEAVKEK